jgi:hypothetical protein
MKKLCITILSSFILSIALIAQVIETGKYHDFFGSELILNQDSTYYYTYHFDLSSSWSIGKWSANKDTIYLKNIPIYDNLTYYDSVNNTTVDKKVLSGDEKSEQISINEAVINEISGGGQNRYLNPIKLLSRKQKLFKINMDGHIMNRKVYCQFRQKRFAQFYVKQ